MLFNSIDFAIFLPVVFLLYWAIFNRKHVMLRNVYLLACSYFFYGVWDWRFLFLIVLSSGIDFGLGLLIGKTDASRPRRRKMLLVVSLVVNLGILGFFKYANFFIDSLAGAFTLFGGSLSVSHLNIILPVGISFYTFQSLSYTIDVYYRKIEPTRDAAAFFAFVSFFPQLVAGPIERAKNLLPQFNSLKTFDYLRAREGVVEIFIGLFKKMVIADRIAVYVDSVFEAAAAGNTDIAGLPAFIGLLFFAFQLYIDFSAYSQIAIGTAKLFGFQLSVNFRRPYLSRSFNNFWERWHISLSQWMRDYIFIPLGGSRAGKWHTVRNLVIVFAVSGLWHGASWNFVIWGIVNALFVILLDPLMAKLKVRGVAASAVVFLMWTLSLSFFRAEGLAAACGMLSSIGFKNAAALTTFGLPANELVFTFCIIALLIVTEYLAERKELKGQKLTDIIVLNRHAAVRWCAYLLLVFSIIFLGIYATNNDNSFIYFQF